MARLKNLRESVRDHYHVGRTLEERLKEAIAGEQYELAAAFFATNLGCQKAGTIVHSAPTRYGRPAD